MTLLFLGLYYHNTINSRYISRNNGTCIVYSDKSVTFSNYCLKVVDNELHSHLILFKQRYR